jgi:hypothetical protein
LLFLILGSLKLWLSHVPCEDGDHKKEKDAKVERKQVFLNAHAILVVSQLLLGSKPQQDGQFLFLMGLMKALNPNNIENVLA